MTKLEKKGISQVSIFPMQRTARMAFEVIRVMAISITKRTKVELLVDGKWALL